MQLVHRMSKYIKKNVFAMLSIAMAFLASIANLHAQTSAASDSHQIYIDRLKHRLDIYTQERAKIANGYASNALWEQGQSTKDYGISTMDELNMFKESGQVAKIEGHDVLSDLLETAGKIKETLKTANELTALQNEPQVGWAGTPVNEVEAKKHDLDIAISKVELYEPAKPGFVKTIAGDYVKDAVLAGLYQKRANLENGTGATPYEMKSLKKSSDFLLKSTVLYAQYQNLIREGGATEVLLTNPEVTSYAVLAGIDYKSIVNLTTWGIAEYKGNDMQNQALALRDNTLVALDRRIQETQLELHDPMSSWDGDASVKRTGEPGGIKFSGRKADGVAFNLDIKSVEYDPVTGKLIFIGTKSQQEFDVDVFADILRLAQEKNEPFFSLDPSNIRDFDIQNICYQKLLNKYYRDPAQLAEKIKYQSNDAIQYRGRTYYYAPLDELDPEIAAEGEHAKDFSIKLVYSPSWLAQSTVGMILFQADCAIKSIASGFIYRNSMTVPAREVWKIPGFQPEWQQQGSMNPGRCNFEIASCDGANSVMQTGSRLDLTVVRPELVVRERKEGTSDSANEFETETTKALEKHFRDNWKEYVERVPEIGRLEVVYRAYVAARFLLQTEPGLAARIERLPRSPGFQLPQQAMRFDPPPVLLACFVNDKPVPIDNANPCLYTFTRWPWGGTEFKASEKVKISYSSSQPVTWAHAGLVSTKLEDDYIENPTESSEAAFALEVVVDPLPASMLSRLKIGLGIFGIGLALAGLLVKHFDWQQISTAHTCEHCNRTHSVLGYLSLVSDVVLVASLFYLLAVPFAAAAYDTDLDWTQYLTSIVDFIGIACAFTIGGSVFLMVLAYACRRRTDHVTLLQGFFCGSRFAAFTLGCALLQSGFSQEAVGGNVVWLLGQKIGERLLVLLGELSFIAPTVVIMLMSVVVSVFLRWIVPLLFDSRPLHLMKTIPHRHTASSTPR